MREVAVVGPAVLESLDFEGHQVMIDSETKPETEGECRIYTQLSKMNAGLVQTHCSLHVLGALESAWDMLCGCKPQQRE